MNRDRTRWDERYAKVDHPSPPTPLLLRWSGQLLPGRALELACGSGSNLVALAERGWHATGIDVSPIALHMARRAALRHSLAIDVIAADLDDFPLPRDRYDLVCSFYFLDRRLADTIAAALRPGGYLLYETFTTAQRALKKRPKHARIYA